MLRAIREHMPALASGLERIEQAAKHGAQAERRETEQVFEALESVSIDYGIMERVEKRLKTSTVSEADVQEFLDTARPEEVNTLIREGWTKAFAKFRLRRRPRFRRRSRD